ncbi:hypothetical protein Hanom_Chr16g01438751 [Helianthus anomalus]
MVSFLYLLKSKLQRSSFMLTQDCKLYPLPLKSTKNILDVCKPLHVTSFDPNSVYLYS